MTKHDLYRGFMILASIYVSLTFMVVLLSL